MRAGFVQRTVITSFILLSLCYVPLAGASSPEAEQSEKALYNGLADLAALTKAGLSYVEYQRRLSDLIVLADRAARNGVDSTELTVAVGEFKQATTPWNEYISAKNQAETEATATLSSLRLQLAKSFANERDIHFSSAYDHIDAYVRARDDAAAEAASAAAKSHKSRKASQKTSK